MRSFKLRLHLVGLLLREVTVLHRVVELRLRVAHDRVDDLVHVDALRLGDVGDRLAVAELGHELVGGDAERLGRGVDLVPADAEASMPEAECRRRLSGSGLLTMSSMSDFATAAIASITVCTSTSCSFGDVGDRRLAVTELGHQILGREAERLRARVEHVTAGPERTDVAVEPAFPPVRALAFGVVGVVVVVDVERLRARRPGTPMSAPATAPPATAATSAVPATNRRPIMRAPSSVSECSVQDRPPAWQGLATALANSAAFSFLRLVTA